MYRVLIDMRKGVSDERHDDAELDQVEPDIDRPRHRWRRAASPCWRRRWVRAMPPSSRRRSRRSPIPCGCGSCRSSRLRPAVRACSCDLEGPVAKSQPTVVTPPRRSGGSRVDHQGEGRALGDVPGRSRSVWQRCATRQRVTTGGRNGADSLGMVQQMDEPVADDVAQEGALRRARVAPLALQLVEGGSGRGCGDVVRGCRRAGGNRVRYART